MPRTTVILRLINRAVFMPLWMTRLYDKTKPGTSELSIVISKEYRLSRESSLSMAACFNKPVR